LTLTFDHVEQQLQQIALDRQIVRSDAGYCDAGLGSVNGAWNLSAGSAPF